MLDAGYAICDFYSFKIDISLLDIDYSIRIAWDSFGALF
jgi:hypothetical protein